MEQKKMFGLIAIFMLLFAGCSSLKDLDSNESKVWLANPASTYCVENGGELDIRKDSDGSQFGVCVFDDFECDEWDFYRGECEAITSVNTTIVAVEDGRIDLLFGDIAESFKYDGDVSEFKVGDNVAVKYADISYGNNSLIEIDHVSIDVVDFDSCVAAGNPVMESYPAKCSFDGTVYVQELSLNEKCELAGGKWISDSEECEYVSEDFCSENNGYFIECGSACRNDPDAKVCTMQCVPICKFNYEEPKICTREYAPVCGVDGKTYSNSCMAGDVDIDYYGECLNEEKKKECENQGGKYEKVGMMQMFTCNMPTSDIGKTCTDSSQCEGMCMGDGKCSDYTENFGCMSIMEDGEQVEICID